LGGAEVEVDEHASAEAEAGVFEACAAAGVAVDGVSGGVGGVEWGGGADDGGGEDGFACGGVEEADFGGTEVLG
jgi:hypothetical protein